MQQLPSLSELNVQPEVDKNCCSLSNFMQLLVTALPLQFAPLSYLYLGKTFNWHCRSNTWLLSCSISVTTSSATVEFHFSKHCFEKSPLLDS